MGRQISVYKTLSNIREIRRKGHFCLRDSRNFADVEMLNFGKNYSGERDDFGKNINLVKNDFLAFVFRGSKSVE